MNKEIDGEKLRKALDSRRLASQVVSKELGYNSGYMSKSINNNQISTQAIQLLDIKYGIKEDEYKIERKKIVQTQFEVEEEPSSDVDFTELYRHLDRNTELMLSALDSIGNDANEQTEALAKMIKTFNVTCTVITKNIEQVTANQNKIVSQLNVIMNRVK